MLESVEKICRNRGPLLLALSGGPDSTALYHLLKEVGHPFEVAHVDHGWRPESAQEAEALERLVSVPFHLKRLEKRKRNLEESARLERLAFFRSLLETRCLEGVVLGHHADDQAETVLKRLFEGARLHNLVGLEEESGIEGVPLLRPLLSYRKKTILNWLDEKGICYFSEPPGADLRSRMRTEIFPFLSAHFGKEIVPSLCRISSYSKELRDHPERFLLKKGVAEFFQNERVAVSNPTLNAVCAHLEGGSAHKRMRIGKGEAVMHRGTLTYNKRIEEE